MAKIERFDAFVAERETLADWEAFVSNDRLRLVRRSVYEACGFARSTLYQNPEIKVRIAELETMLRARGVLQPGSEGRDLGSRDAETKAKRDADISALARRLEQLQVAIRDLEQHIERYRPSQDPDATTGTT